MKTWIKDTLILSAIFILGASGVYVQHISRNTIHMVVAEAFGSTCVEIGQPFLTCSCVLERAAEEMSTEEFNSMNLRVFGEDPTPEDTSTLVEWIKDCNSMLEERYSEEGPFDIIQGMGDIENAPSIEM